MNNTISFTPSNEQLIQIANENPELNSQIKRSVVEALEKSAVKYIQHRLQDKANTAYENLFRETQQSFFNNKSSYYNSVFSNTLESQFKSKIEESLTQAVQEEFDAYINSNDFKRTLKAKVHEKILNSAMKALDEQILEETKKLIA